ncbi:NAD-dependent malic enzyme [Candidatus Saccharibacteria bacterium CG11_big_fil_rev_8_21_14_0_20_41_19]|nr:MAG: NAD-dependent malic enzyme [Candidatus Saccharibacteria bacterium CG2_30_41_52]PIQ70698.1 MAG: NAD-dependent malic enzyme [Candidatus Saccharibacteria bacterium CG11_big_fil_rev_8_21_14_0_20_41_19]PIZ59279.1 MAG: NAD-dependent malic enzyme [Candidatus Saccharibacteria bacterium CG_4_10_14_0_2_um_filter_41_11]PJC30053.1 MAG: NAD-dependent malic enzyme [Candidatus Saccharibacteria bacterium CG_4_9_14_0_2_um_filter_41_9]PJE65903.1 MAG: NAD-dependent malic enzyme [Candidatus Saccharibacteri
MQNDVYQRSLELHKRHHGKLEVVSKVKLNSSEVLSMAYTPGVAEVCREIARDPSLAREYTIKRNTIAIVSDGSAILGLGNLGALAAIPVMEGKAAIFKEFAGVDAFPICLDTQDTEEIIKAVKQIAPVFGGINLEDISAPRCFEIEARLRAELPIPVMHDDQWGTATVNLAGIINALKLTNQTKESVRVVINGVGSAGVATARLLLHYGLKNILFCDSQGIIHKGRKDLTAEKMELISGSVAESFSGTLTDAVKGSNIFIGLSKPGLLTGDMVKTMAEKPIILALSNPVPEIMPDEAIAAGAYIIATGRSDFPNQLNNLLAFPGIFKGMLEANIHQFKIEMFESVAKALADLVVDLSPTKILPTMFEPRVVNTVSETIKRYV